MRCIKYGALEIDRGRIDFLLDDVDVDMVDADSGLNSH